MFGNLVNARLEVFLAGYAGKQGGTGDIKSRDVTTTSVPSFKFPCPAFIVASAPVKSYTYLTTNTRSIAAELCPLVSWTYYRT